MERFGLRDDQWNRIKDILPGREGHVGGTAPASEHRYSVHLDGSQSYGAVCGVARSVGYGKPSARRRGRRAWASASSGLGEVSRGCRAS